MGLAGWTPHINKRVFQVGLLAVISPGTAMSRSPAGWGSESAASVGRLSTHLPTPVTRSPALLNFLCKSLTGTDGAVILLQINRQIASRNANGNHIEFHVEAILVFMVPVKDKLEVRFTSTFLTPGFIELKWIKILNSVQNYVFLFVLYSK